MKVSLSDRAYWIALGLVPGLHLTLRCRLLEKYSSARGVFEWAHNVRETASALRHLQESLRAFDFAAVDREIEAVAALGGRIYTFSDPEYPECFRSLNEPPAFISVQGEYWPTLIESPRRLGVVGSRDATAYGVMVTRSLVGPLALDGCVIVSGGAVGIDAVAHRSALEAGGQTVVVLGSGLGEIYPRGHRQLFAAVGKRGAIVSEYAAHESARPGYFPQRNRLVAGLSGGVLVTEAKARSGALITARLALEQGKEVMAVPGSVQSEQSEGTNGLIQQGAFLVRRAADIRLLMNWQEKPGAPGAAQVETVEMEILKEMGHTPVSRQEILDRLNCQPATVARLLMDLQEKGWVMPLQGDLWIRSIQGSEVLWQKP